MCWDRGQMVGFSQAACPVSDGPLPGLLGASEDVSGEERPGRGALHLVLCANLLCCFGQDLDLSGPSFHFL